MYINLTDQLWASIKMYTIRDLWHKFLITIGINFRGNLTWEDYKSPLSEGLLIPQSKGFILPVEDLVKVSLHQDPVLLLEARVFGLKLLSKMKTANPRP